LERKNRQVLSFQNVFLSKTPSAGEKLNADAFEPLLVANPEVRRDVFRI
jgi:hypothetical protein